MHSSVNCLVSHVLGHTDNREWQPPQKQNVLHALQNNKYARRQRSQGCSHNGLSACQDLQSTALIREVFCISVRQCHFRFFTYHPMSPWSPSTKTSRMQPLKGHRSNNGVANRVIKMNTSTQNKRSLSRIPLKSGHNLHLRSKSRHCQLCGPTSTPSYFWQLVVGEAGSRQLGCQWCSSFELDGPHSQHSSPSAWHERLPPSAHS